MISYSHTDLKTLDWLLCSNHVSFLSLYVSADTMVNPGGSAQPPPVGAGSLSWKRCAGCGGKIADRFLLYAMDSYWHSRCLKCSCCQAQLGEIGTSCYTKSGMILCRNDYIRLDTFIIEVPITTTFMCLKTVSALRSFCVHKGHSLKFLQISDALVKLILNGNVFWSFEDSLVLLGCFFMVFEAKLQIVHTSGHYDSPATTWNDIRHVMIRWSDGCQEKKILRKKLQAIKLLTEQSVFSIENMCLRLCRQRPSLKRAG